MLKIIMVNALLVLSFITMAQKNGDIINKISIQNSEELSVYVKNTENRTNASFNKERYKSIKEINLFGITYYSDGLKVNGFLLIPNSDEKFPVIIYNRGGSFNFGSLTTNGSIRLGELAKISAQGYIIVASQYRGNGGGEGREEFGGSDVNDVLNLFPLIDNLPQADIENIGMFGWSRGGMMTYISNTRTNRLKAIAVGGALSDLKSSFDDRPDWGEYIADSVSLYKQNEEEFLNSRSAINLVDKFPLGVPILMMHGTSDWRVKPSCALAMALEFDKYRIPYKLIMYDGADHAILEHKQDVFDQLINWFDRFLKNNEPVPDMKYHGK
ncbi:MAG: prolyl oligopeptidase family serine peptidase [Bacteroidales bacterium]|nr:prolyl oligopeptidase family serine peptidase [Bacteroidales bacterium]